MDMFKNYDYIPGTNIPCNRCPSTVDFSRVKRPLEMYNIKSEFIGFGWKYRDSIILEFETTGEVIYNDAEHYVDAETYLDDKAMEFTMYDFRGEVVYNQVLPAGVVVKYFIDEHTSARLVKGVYTFRLSLVDIENNIRHTLMSSEDDECSLYIN